MSCFLHLKQTPIKTCAPNVVVLEGVRQNEAHLRQMSFLWSDTIS